MLPNPKTEPKCYSPVLRKVAHDVGGINALAKICHVRVSAAWRWVKRGHLPRTEWTGETRYAELIEAATNGAVTKAELLTHKPQRKCRSPSSCKPTQLS